MKKKLESEVTEMKMIVSAKNQLDRLRSRATAAKEKIGEHQYKVGNF